MQTRIFIANAKYIGPFAFEATHASRHQEEKLKTKFGTILMFSRMVS
jgi:hypothetical protein